MLLEKEGGFEIIADCNTGTELLEILEYKKPDILLTELTMDELSGLDALPLIKHLYPELKIVVFSFINEPAIILKTIKYGVNGYVTTSDPSEELIKALKFCMGPGIYVGPGCRKLYTLTLKEITKKERHVLLLLLEKRSVEYISNRLALPVNLIEVIIERLLAAAGVGTIEDLMKTARAEGVI